jgi:hypothetical protein
MRAPAQFLDGLRRKHWTTVVASGLLFAVSAMMVVWAACTLSRAGEFGTAAYAFSATHQDVDLAPGLFEVAFVGGAVVSILFAIILLFIGFFDLGGTRPSRVLTGLASCAALPFTYLTYQKLGEPYMFPGDMRESSQAPMRILAPWRYSGWYHALTVGFGDAIVGCLVLAIILIALPVSGRHFRVAVR